MDTNFSMSLLPFLLLLLSLFPVLVPIVLQNSFVVHIHFKLKWDHPPFRETLRTGDSFKVLLNGYR